MKKNNVAAIYARRSLDIRDSTSIASQREIMLKYAKDKGLTVPKEFIFVDDGMLGGEEDRPAFCDLRAAIRSGRIGSAIAYDLDRLSRKQALTLLVMDECAQHEVALEFVTTPVEDTPEGKMFLQIKGVFAEYEKYKIRERTSRGRMQMAKQGKHLGRATYGYDKNGYDLVINEAQAQIVRLIFEWVIAGKPLNRVAVDLTDGHYPTARGAKKWNGSTIYKIISNRAYYGARTYNERESCLPATRRRTARAGKSKRTSQKRRDESLWISVPCPAIIPKETFDQAQEALRRSAQINGGRPAKYNVYALRGICRCAYCDHAVCGYAHHMKDRPFYRCNNLVLPHRTRNCKGRSHKVRELEQVVFDTLVSTVSDPATLLSVARPEIDDQTGKRREELVAKIATLRQREERAEQMALDADGASFSRLETARKKAQEARRDAERELAALEPDRPQLTHEGAYRLCRIMQAAFSREDRRENIRRFVELVRLADDYAEITFRLPGDDGGVKVSPALVKPTPNAGKNHLHYAVDVNGFFRVTRRILLEPLRRRSEAA